MYINHLELRLARLPLVRHFETSFGRVTTRAFLLLRMAGEGLVTWSEAVVDEQPFYSAETTETAWHVIERFLGPAVLGRRYTHPRDVFTSLAFVRGHRMAKAAIEMGMWALHATASSRPLSHVLGGTRTAIASGVSIGIQDSTAALVERVAEECAAGYQRVKVKIKPGWDVEPIGELRRAFGAFPLMADANAAYTMASVDRLAALDAFDLTMIEQPLDHDDVRDHAVLARRLATPICLDESIESPGRASEAIALGACRVVNVKPGRLGGFAESIRVHDLCAAAGVPVWHGGMLETGIGRAYNVHLASLPNFSLPGDIAASRRYYAPDLIEPGIDVQRDGTIPVPTTPGLGVVLDEERVQRATERLLTLTAR